MNINPTVDVKFVLADYSFFSLEDDRHGYDGSYGIHTLVLYNSELQRLGLIADGCIVIRHIGHLSQTYAKYPAFFELPEQCFIPEDGRSHRGNEIFQTIAQYRKEN